MASILQSPQWSSRSGPEGEDLTRIERWFLRQGVPQFVYGYGPGRDSMPVLFYLLLIVVAFDLAVQPWVSLNPLFLLVAPAVLVLVGLVLGLFVKATIIDQGPYLIRELGEEGTLKRQLSYLIANPARLAKLLAGVYVMAFLVFLLGRDVYWNDFSMDFAVIAVLLWSSARLLRPDLWSEDATLREQQRLYAVVAVAVVGFALEGSILPDAPAMMGGVLGSFAPGAVPVPQAFAALLVTAAILLQSQSLIPATGGAGEVATRQRFNVFFPAVPLLVLVLCIETAILPYVGSDWVAAAVPLAAMIALASLHLLLRRWPTWLTMPAWLKTVTSHPSVRRFITYPGVTSLVVLYLVACPLLVGILAAAEGDQLPAGTATSPVDASSALLLTLVVNLLYLSLVVSIAVFRLQEVARWAFKEALTGLRQRIANLGRGLSILVVFAALALLTAETWEAMLTISTRDYVLLVAAILGLAGAFHLITSVQHVSRTAAFRTWKDVREAAMPDQPPDPEIKELLDSRELHHARTTNDAPTCRLGVLETINSVIVMMTYEIFFFFPVAILAAIVFLTFGRITVPDRVAANWVYGDRAKPEELVELMSLRFFQQPWVRVGLLLTVFAILYLVVEILSDPDRRKTYFESADKAVRQRLAVRLAYCEVRARRGLPQPGDPGPARRDRHVQHRGTPHRPASSHP